MQYGFYGDTLKLIQYNIIIEEELDGEVYSVSRKAFTEKERDNLLKCYPGAKVISVDNTGYEWLDGMIFTQEQIKNGEVNRAIEMGEKAYMEMKAATNQDVINAMLLLKVAELTAELTEVKGNG